MLNEIVMGLSPPQDWANHGCTNLLNNKRIIDFNSSPESMTRHTAHHLLIFGGEGQLSIWNKQKMLSASFLLAYCPQSGKFIYLKWINYFTYGKSQRITFINNIYLRNYTNKKNREDQHGHLLLTFWTHKKEDTR